MRDLRAGGEGARQENRKGMKDMKREFFHVFHQLHVFLLEFTRLPEAERNNGELRTLTE